MYPVVVAGAAPLQELDPAATSHLAWGASGLSELQNHLGWKDLQAHLLPPRAMGRDTFHWSKLLQDTASLVPSDPPAAVLALATCTAQAPQNLSVCREGCPPATASEGKLCSQCLERKRKHFPALEGNQACDRPVPTCLKARGRREAVACLRVQQGCCSETDFPRLLPCAQPDRPHQLPPRSIALDVTGKPQLPILPP